MSEPQSNNQGSTPAHQLGHAGRIARNVLSNWIWYALVLVSGFLLPRLIDRHQGRELLGLWDIGWSFVSYVSFLSLGISSAVSRYVARHRATEAWDELNTMVNSSLALLLGSAAIGLCLVGILSSMTDLIVQDAQPAARTTAVWVVLLLGIQASLHLPLGVFNAIITGYDRFDLLNLIRGIRDLIQLTAMIILLYAGFGIAALACTVLVAELIAGFVKVFVARRICPTLQLSFSHCTKQSITTITAFGGKSFLRGLSKGWQYQTNTILVGIFLGPAALAVYARQRALVMHMIRFVRQFAHVLVPTSSSMDALEDKGALGKLLVESSRVGLLITIPLVLVFVIMGEPLLTVWMGAEYAAPTVLTVMAIGHAVSVPQISAYFILVGMGRHGRPAALELIAALVSVGATFVMLGPFSGGMVAAAAALSLPGAVTGGFLIPYRACRLLNINFTTYLRRITLGPLIATLPLAACLIIARLVFPLEPLTALAVGTGIGGLLTALVYWSWILPEPLQSRIRLTLRRMVTGSERKPVEADVEAGQT